MRAIYYLMVSQSHSNDIIGVQHNSALFRTQPHVLRLICSDHVCMYVFGMGGSIVVTIYTCMHTRYM